jgi:hypothetical protein
MKFNIEDLDKADWSQKDGDNFYRYLSGELARQTYGRGIMQFVHLAKLVNKHKTKLSLNHLEDITKTLFNLKKTVFRDIDFSDPEVRKSYGADEPLNENYNILKSLIHEETIKGTLKLKKDTPEQDIKNYTDKGFDVELNEHHITDPVEQKAWIIKNLKDAGAPTEKLHKVNQLDAAKTTELYNKLESIIYSGRKVNESMSEGYRSVPIPKERLSKYGLTHFKSSLTVYEQIEPWSNIQQEALESELINTFDLSKRSNHIMENTELGVGYEDYKGGKFWVYCTSPNVYKVKSILDKCWKLDKGDIRQTKSEFTDDMEKNGFTVSPNGQGTKKSKYFFLRVIPDYNKAELHPISNFPNTGTTYAWFKGSHQMKWAINNLDVLDEKVDNYSNINGINLESNSNLLKYRDLLKDLVPTINEVEDINSPLLMKLRSPVKSTTPPPVKSQGNPNQSKIDKINSNIEKLEKAREEISLEMESDPEVIDNMNNGNHPSVTHYGDLLTKIDDKIFDLIRKRKALTTVNEATDAEKFDVVSKNLIQTNKDLQQLAKAYETADGGAKKDLEVKIRRKHKIKKELEAYKNQLDKSQLTEKKNLAGKGIKQ